MFESLGRFHGVRTGASDLHFSSILNIDSSSNWLLGWAFIDLTWRYLIRFLPSLCFLGFEEFRKSEPELQRQTYVWKVVANAVEVCQVDDFLLPKYEAAISR